MIYVLYLLCTHSAVFRTGWPTHPDVVGQPVIQLGVSIERYVCYCYLVNIIYGT
jgi:hypothetical protein